MSEPVAAGAPFDLVLSGGEVVDGTGSPRFIADLGIVGDEVVEIGDLAERAALRSINVAGHIVAPGFVDALHNADMAVLLSPDVDMALSQGVTTALVGCCGMSMAPVSPEHRADVRCHAFFKTGRHEMPWDWFTVAEYLARVDRASAINVATLAGFDNIWFATRGFDAHAPSTKELDTMRGLAAECMDQGAIGMSHGAGAASLWSTHEHVVHVARGLTGTGGVYACHQRFQQFDDPFWWIREGAGVGLEAQIATHFLHFKSTNPRTHGREQDMLDVVDELRASGPEITLGSYPYASGGGGVRVPDWAEEGGPEETRKRLADPILRQRIVDEVQMFWTWNPHFTAITNDANQWMEGRHLDELAEEAGVSPGELICRLVESDYGSQHVHDHGGADGIETIMQHENHIACSDAIYAGEHPHPRCFGAYPRYLGVHVRERGTLTLEECIRQMTSSPARMMGLADRGELRVGQKADIVVFDPNTVGDRSSAETPRRPSDGIEHVIVNGTVVREHGAFTGATPGRGLTRPVR